MIVDCGEELGFVYVFEGEGGYGVSEGDGIFNNIIIVLVVVEFTGLEEEAVLVVGDEDVGVV